MKFLKQIIPNGMKHAIKTKLSSMGYELVYFQKPSEHHRYPYANQRSFFEDIQQRGFDPKQVIDIGANVGGWSTEFAEVFPSAASLLVEPQEELIPGLKALCAAHKGWKLAQVGVGAKSETRPFKACADTVSSTFSTSETADSIDPDIRMLEIVDLKSLADRFIPNTKIDLIKIDAEGLELEILEGGCDVIRNAQIVMLEVSFFEFSPKRPSFSQLVAKMDELGFAIYDFTMFYRRPHDGALGLMDCVFVSKNGPLRQSNIW